MRYKERERAYGMWWEMSHRTRQKVDRPQLQWGDLCIDNTKALKEHGRAYNMYTPLQII